MSKDKEPESYSDADDSGDEPGEYEMSSDLGDEGDEKVMVADGDGDVSDEDESDYDERLPKPKKKSERRMTKAEREVQEASNYLLVNKERIEKSDDWEDEVSDDELPPIDKMKRPLDARKRGGSTDDYFDLSAEMQTRYVADMKEIGTAFNINALYGSQTHAPYPMLNEQMKSRLGSMSPSDIHRLAVAIKGHTEAHNALQESMCGGMAVQEGIGWLAEGIQYFATENGYRLTGYADNVNSAFSTQMPLCVRVYHKWIDPLLAKLTGGKNSEASDLLMVGMMMAKAAKDTYNINALEDERRVRLEKQGTTKVPETLGEEAARKVREEIGPPPPSGSVGGASSVASSDNEAIQRWMAMQASPPRKAVFEAQ